MRRGSYSALRFSGSALRSDAASPPAAPGGESGRAAAASTSLAAAFGEQHERPALACAKFEQAVALAVVEHALGAGEHGVVVGHHRHRGAVDGAGAGDQAVGRGLPLQLVERPPAALCRHGKGAVLGEAAFIEEVGEVLARAAQAASMAARHRLRPRRVDEQRAASLQALQVGTRDR
jgi:hypothetical protein